MLYMKLSRDEIILLCASGIYACAITIANVFSNVYLFKYCNSLSIMALFTICKCLFMLLAFYVFTKYELNTIKSMKIGVGFLILTFCIILYFHSIFKYVCFLLLVGCLWGFGEGGFYLSMNTLNQLATRKQARMKFVGYNGAINAFVAVLAPLLASLSIVLMKDDIKGYLLSFQLVIILFILLIFVLRYIKIENTHHDKKDMSMVFKKSLKEKRWRFIITINYFQGFRESLSLCITGLLVFESMKSNSTLYAGILSSFSFIAILSNIALSKWMNTNKRDLLFLIGNIGIFFSGMILVWNPSFSHALLHGVSHNLFVPFISMPIMFYSMNVLQESIKQQEFAARLVIREFFLETGRITGLLAYYILNIVFVHQDVIPFLFIYISSMILYFYTKRRKNIQIACQ